MSVVVKRYIFVSAASLATRLKEEHNSCNDNIAKKNQPNYCANKLVHFCGDLFPSSNVDDIWLSPSFKQSVQLNVAAKPVELSKLFRSTLLQFPLISSATLGDLMLP